MVFIRCGDTVLNADNLCSIALTGDTVLIYTTNSGMDVIKLVCPNETDARQALEGLCALLAAKVPPTTSART